MAWVLLLAAGALETVFALALKQSEGLTRPVPTVVFALAALGSFGLLTLALRDLPVGTAYAVWTGIGAAGTAIVGMAFLGDAASTARMVSVGLVLAGVVGLNLTGAGHG